MRHNMKQLNVAATAIAGSAQVCKDWQDKWVQLVGVAGGATFVIEGTIDGSTWAPVSATLSANGIYEVPENLAKVRINRTTLGTGTPLAYMAYREGRSE